jgi:hypothetical protein
MITKGRLRTEIKNRICVFVFITRHTKRKFVTANDATSRVAFLALCTFRNSDIREERRLRVFENRVLRGIFGPKRDDVTGEWRKLCESA